MPCELVPSWRWLRRLGSAPAPATAAAAKRPRPGASALMPRPTRRAPRFRRSSAARPCSTARAASSPSADVLMRDGRIVAVGPSLAAPEGATVIDGAGRFVTPGIIDVHSHLGVYPSPGINATSDGNEATDPNTAEVWAEHSVWPQDPGFWPRRRRRHHHAAYAARFGEPVRRPRRDAAPGAWRAHGAGDEIPRRAAEPEDGVRRKSRARLWRAEFFPCHRHGQCRRLPRRVRAAPRSTTGACANSARAARAIRPIAICELETLAGVLNGDILLQWHCYRADEMANAIEDLARIRLPHRRVSSRGRGLQDRRPAGARGNLRGDVGRLVGLQDRSL